MTGLGEDVYTDRPSVLDSPTEESQRMGMYGDAPDVEKMVEEAAAAYHAIRSDNRRATMGECMTAALESLGIPLSVLAAIRAGEWVAVPVAPTERMMRGTANTICVSPNIWDLYLKAAPKTPEAAR